MLPGSVPSKKNTKTFVTSFCRILHYIFLSLKESLENNFSVRIFNCLVVFALEIFLKCLQ